MRPVRTETAVGSRELLQALGRASLTQYRLFAQRVPCRTGFQPVFHGQDAHATSPQRPFPGLCHPIQGGISGGIPLPRACFATPGFDLERRWRSGADVEAGEHTFVLTIDTPARMPVKSTVRIGDAVEGRAFVRDGQSMAYLWP